MTKIVLSIGALSLGVAILIATSIADGAQHLQAGPNEIAGIVTGPRGPEAGVWVIAETSELPTKFVRIVVTDDQGRYLIPDLPKATYDVWVRGYGLVDSPKSRSVVGKTLNLEAVRSKCARRRCLLSRRLLALDAAGAGEERVSRHGAHRQRHFAEREVAG